MRKLMRRLYDKTPSEFDTAEGEQLTTKKASNEDSSLDIDDDNMLSFDWNKNTFDFIKQYRLKNTN